MSTTTADLLRAPAAIAQRCRAREDLRDLTATSIVFVIVGGASFGAALGSYRGDIQVLWSSIKVPLAMLATLAVCAPAFHGILVSLRQPMSLSMTVSLVLAAAARASLVLLGCAPILWLAIQLGLGYHMGILAAVAAYGAAGLASLWILFRGFETRGRLTIALSFAAVLVAVGGQAAWMLRPYMGRPSQQSIPFVRSPDCTFGGAVVTSALSAGGVYRRSAPSDKEECW